MTGSKHISDLITTQDALKKGRINIIDADVSAGKTWFALTTIPKWTNPEKILYLIDTTNGEMHIQNNIIAVGRMKYALCDYATGVFWGEKKEVEGKLPVMTYAGFGAEVLKKPKEGTKFDWHKFDFIICDEMQNLVDYQRFNKRCPMLEAAEDELRKIIAEGKTKIIAMSATPEKIRDRFKGLCYDVPFNRDELRQLETFSRIPYYGKVEDLLLKQKGKTGILYTTKIEDMERYIEFANSHGISASGFWSIAIETHKKHPLSPAQTNLRKTVLTDETIPDDIDLLVINRASETCIKIQSEKRKVDYIIVHDSNEEIQTQVRGRYHGDLPEFYYHDYDDLNLYKIRKHGVPERFLNKRLYTEDINELGWELDLRNKDGKHCGNPSILKYIAQCGYVVSDDKKDRKRNGKHYRIISLADTNSSLPYIEKTENGNKWDV